MFPFEKGVAMPHHENDDLAVNTREFKREDRAAIRAELPPTLPVEDDDDLNGRGFADELSTEANARIRTAEYRSDADVAKDMRGLNFPGRVFKDFPLEEEGDSLVGIAASGQFKAPFEHLNFLEDVLARDAEFILRKDVEYNSSWKYRGGVGAFMMLARKWDRMEPLAKTFGYDIFAMLKAHPDRIDDVRDLRRYLALVESEALKEQWIAPEE
jgi:hypothetical protein